MARQAAQSKVLFYPTGDQVIDLLSATWLTNPAFPFGRSCVGEGQALAKLKSVWG